MIGLWRRRFLIVEPLLVLIAVGAVVYWSEWCGGWALLDAYLAGTRSTLYSTLTGLSGSLLGFVIAGFAITVSSLGSSRLERVREHASTLNATFSTATLYLGLATLTGLIALVFDRDDVPVRWLSYGALLFISLSTLGVARCVWILHNVVGIVGGPPKSRAADE